MRYLKWGFIFSFSVLMSFTISSVSTDELLAQRSISEFGREAESSLSDQGHLQIGDLSTAELLALLDQLSAEKEAILNELELLEQHDEIQGSIYFD